MVPAYLLQGSHVPREAQLVNATVKLMASKLIAGRVTFAFCREIRKIQCPPYYPKPPRRIPLSTSNPTRTPNRSTNPGPGAAQNRELKRESTVSASKSGLMSSAVTPWASGLSRRTVFAVLGPCEGVQKSCRTLSPSPQIGGGQKLLTDRLLTLKGSYLILLPKVQLGHVILEGWHWSCFFGAPLAVEGPWRAKRDAFRAWFRC